VEGAADLLVEQDVAGEAVDLEVGADGELAQVAFASVSAFVEADPGFSWQAFTTLPSCQLDA
jgi:hypothetical protein